MLIRRSYNSAVYQSVYAFDYAVFQATETMVSPNSTIRDLGLSTWHSPATEWGQATPPDVVARKMYELAATGGLSRQTPEECISDYAKPFQTTRGSLILVTADDSNAPYIYSYNTLDGIKVLGLADTFGWICGDVMRCPNKTTTCPVLPLCPGQVSQLDPADWRPFGAKVEYCLSEPMEQQCSIELSVPLAIIVIICNTVKAAILLFILYCVKGDPLLTTGDAISSFLERQDGTTKGMCLMSKHNIHWWQGSSRSTRRISEQQPGIFRRCSNRWHTVVSRGRWWTCLAL